MGDLIAKKPSFDDIIDAFRELNRRMTEAEMPSGTQVAQLVKQMQDMVAEVHTITDGLNQRVDTQVQSAISENSYTKAVIDSKVTTWNWGVLTPSKGGTGQSNSYNNDLSSTTRRASWVDSNGNLGIALSSQDVKQDIETSDLTEANLRAIQIVKFRYKTAVEQQGDDAPVELGVVAEQVADKVPDIMLYHDSDGKIIGFEYMLSGLLGLQLAQYNANRLDALEQRIKMLETKE